MFLSMDSCKGPPCDDLSRCFAAGGCTYKSSAEQAAEYLAEQQRVATAEFLRGEDLADRAPVDPRPAPVEDFSGKADGLGFKGVMRSPKSGVQMLDPRFLIGIGDVLTHGASKYAANNWLRGMSWTVVFGAVLRHLFAWFMGERLDRKEKGGSGLPHLYHAACGIMFLAHYDDSAEHQQFDDRVYK